MCTDYRHRCIAARRLQIRLQPTLRSAERNSGAARVEPALHLGSLTSMDLDISRTEPGNMNDGLQLQTPSRHEKSLGLLTTKFVTLLQEAKDGVLDLKLVSYS